MKQFLLNLGVGFIVLFSIVGASNTLLPSTAHAAGCTTSFFGLPNWWRGLAKTNTASNGQTSCVVDISSKGSWQNGVVTIGVNLLDDLLRLSGLIAVLFIIYGGVRYIISQGNASELTTAKQTITRAVAGLVIAIAAVFILNYIAGDIFKLTIDPNNYQVSWLQGV